MKNRHLKKQWLLTGAAAAALALYARWENSALAVSNFTVASKRIPAAFSGFRIAQISDLHNAEFGKNNAKLLQKLSECKPDMIVITGDLVDCRRTDMDAALQFSKAAARIADTYYVPGNHESRLEQYDALKAGLARAGVMVLEDAAASVCRDGGELTLIGLSDPSFSKRGEAHASSRAITEAKLKPLLRNAGNYTILLSHRPDLLDIYKKCGVDLAFCGHAHGGQFRLPGIGGLFAPNQGIFPQYDAGVYAEGGTAMVVSRGLGNSSFPIRLNNRPELVAVTLKGL